jgi:hypothetical protein
MFAQTRQLLLFTALQPHATSLLTGLFTLLRTPGTQLSDNGIKCVMRTISTLKSAVLPFTEHIINELSEKLIEVRVLALAVVVCLTFLPHRLQKILLVHSSTIICLNAIAF